MKKILSSFLMLICFVSLRAQQDYREEFNGPYPSWANVKTRFRAAGDGKKDDTKSIQLALDSLGEDPNNTIIKWDGSMFFSNRSAYVKFSQITWDANNKKVIEALGIHYKDMVEPFFAPTSLE